MPTTINCVMFIFYQDWIILICTQFRSGGHANVQFIGFITPLINNVQINANQYIARAICDIVQWNLHFIQFLNNNGGEIYENLAIMITDGISNPSVDLSVMSDEFNKRGIVWALTAVRTPDFPIWELYHTVANNTGGAYILLLNAPVILERVILSVINDEITLRQAFLRVNTTGGNLLSNASVMTNGTGDTSEQSETTDGVGDMPFDQGLSD